MHTEGNPTSSHLYFILRIICLVSCINIFLILSFFSSLQFLETKLLLDVAVGEDILPIMWAAFSLKRLCPLIIQKLFSLMSSHLLIVSLLSVLLVSYLDSPFYVSKFKHTIYFILYQFQGFRSRLYYELSFLNLSMIVIIFCYQLSLYFFLVLLKF